MQAMAEVKEDSKRGPEQDDRVIKVLSEKPGVTTCLMKSNRRNLIEQGESNGNKGSNYENQNGDQSVLVKKHFESWAKEFFDKERRAYKLIGPKFFVPSVLDCQVLTPEGGSYINLEYFAHENIILEDQLEIVDVFTKILKAVAYLSGVGIVHNDISRGNVLWNKNPSGEFDVKIIDFSYSWREGVEGRGEYYGTSGYVAPEIWKGSGGECSKSDVWSIGVMLFEQVFEVNAGGNQEGIFKEICRFLESPEQEIKRMGIMGYRTDKFDRLILGLMTGLLWLDMRGRMDANEALLYVLLHKQQCN